MSKLQTTEGGFRMLQQGVGLRQGQQAADLLELFIGPLGGWLDDRLDRRLVRTFWAIRFSRRSMTACCRMMPPMRTSRSAVLRSISPSIPVM